MSPWSWALRCYWVPALSGRPISPAADRGSNFRIWRAYNNVYWPTIYLVDKKGLSRYRHIGEGAYAETERMIAALLKEM